MSFGHVTSIGRRVIVLGGGNTAMDCCRSSKRLGGSDVKVIVRSPFEEMKASPWEKEDAIHEGIPILDCLVPKAFLHSDGKLTGMSFDKVRAVRDAKGRRQLVSTGEPEQVFECDDVLVAVGQENAFPWIERDAGIAFDEWGMPVLDAITLQSSLPRVFFGGDAALGPKNIIWAVAQGHAAAISIDKFLHGEDVTQRPAPGVTLVSQKMGIHEWSYDNDITPELRHKVPWRDVNQSLRNIKVEVELGFDVADGVEGSAALPQLRRADGVRDQPVHRVRRLRRHLPDRLHHLHRQRRRGRPAHAPARAGAPRRPGALRLRPT